MLMHHRCYNLGLSTSGKSRPSLRLAPILSVTIIVVHIVLLAGTVGNIVASHTESPYSVYTATLVNDSELIAGQGRYGGS